ncbi:HET-domain-containing protein [Hyaloscypha variabilis F]|uniref:HET-domain-containing protein n=1 Tax=Hyaloscypha variabilis (strain UAMH 11265 / GT02V1 / F) TaxID=1149755 RepID=A0A2J6RF02_HYAVF|nr:HET-domain-containing protein [Hyaloscypha variabilis F]
MARLSKISKRKRESTSSPRFSWSSPLYEHIPLPSTTSIRILELQPGEGTETIACRLFAVESARAPPYEAISYAWGRETDTRVINCENRKLRVTANLRDALWRIRDPVKVKLLWADAVCINQLDNEERGFQVRQMPSIYANAVRVLVWIDLPSSAFKDFDLLFDSDTTKYEDASEEGMSMGSASRILNEHVARLEVPGQTLENLDPDTRVVASALCQLFEAPWFKRLWVVQEIGMAKSVLALIGDISIDFVDLIRFILRLERRTVLMDELGLFIAGKANVYTTFPARSREMKGEVDDDYNFLEMLEVTRNKRASDPRDYVYALLGHPSASINGVSIVEPDYNKSATELCFEVTMKILEHSHNLRILSAVHHSEHSLDRGTSSWIPTWNRDVVVLSLGVYQDHYFDVEYDACTGMDAFWKLSEPDRSLEIHGFVFDVVEEHIETEELGDDGATVLREFDDLMSAMLHFKFLDGASPGERLAAVGQTITAGFRNQDPKAFQVEYVAFRHQLAQEALKYGRSISHELIPEGMDILYRTSGGRSIDDIYWAASRFCSGRKVFCTKQGMLGLGPAVLRQGDMCCVLFGAQVPFILRRIGEKWNLVGEAYVHGAMKGEAVVDWMIGEKCEKQTFRLI